MRFDPYSFEHLNGQYDEFITFWGLPNMLHREGENVSEHSVLRNCWQNLFDVECSIMKADHIFKGGCHGFSTQPVRKETRTSQQ